MGHPAPAAPVVLFPKAVDVGRADRTQRVYFRGLHLFPDAGLIPMPSVIVDRPRSWRFRIAAHSRCFDGHFDGAPIFPGVAHLALALDACFNETGGRGVLIGLRDFRLMHPLRPDDEVEVVLTGGKDPSTVRFVIRCQEQDASAGLLVFMLDDERFLA